MTKVPIKVHKWRERNGRTMMDIGLHHTRSIPGEVWWSPNGNSYAVAEDPNQGPRHENDSACWQVKTPDGNRWVRVYSINGMGEVRWEVMTHYLDDYVRMEDAGTKMEPHWDCVEMMQACQYFQLEPV